MKKQKDGILKSGGFAVIFGLLCTVGYILILPSAIADPSGSVAAVTLLYCVFGLGSLILGIYGIRNWYKRTKGETSSEGDGHGIFQSYKVEWLWDSACETYCRNKNMDSGDLSDEDNDEIYELAGNDAALFLTWIIKRNFFVTEDDYLKEYVNDVKTKKATGSDFLCNACDYKLSRSDFSDEITGFVDDYFQHDGAHTSGDFTKDYESFITNDLNKELYTVKFSWDEYTDFKKYIDKAYKKYRSMNEDK